MIILPSFTTVADCTVSAHWLFWISCVLPGGSPPSQAVAALLSRKNRLVCGTYAMWHEDTPENRELISICMLSTVLAPLASANCTVNVTEAPVPNVGDRLMMAGGVGGMLAGVILATKISFAPELLKR